VGSSCARLLTAHLLVSNRIFVAFRLSTTGAYVSGIQSKTSRETRKPNIAFTHMVHLQPSGLAVIKLPAMGPITGPTKAAPSSVDKATPLSIESHISAKPPLTVARGAAPNKPQRKRQTSIVSMLYATATGMQKIDETNTPVKEGSLRPNRSEIGPKAAGPNAYP
jgi:hypothetical protein